MNKYVITGGAGFIGSALVRVLAEEGSVVVIDNLLTGRERNLDDVRTASNSIVPTFAMHLPLLH